MVPMCQFIDPLVSDPQSAAAQMIRRIIERRAVMHPCVGYLSEYPARCAASWAPCPSARTHRVDECKAREIALIIGDDRAAIALGHCRDDHVECAAGTQLAPYLRPSTAPRSTRPDRQTPARARRTDAAGLPRRGTSPQDHAGACLRASAGSRAISRPWSAPVGVA